MASADEVVSLLFSTLLSKEKEKLIECFVLGVLPVNEVPMSKSTLFRVRNFHCIHRFNWKISYRKTWQLKENKKKLSQNFIEET